MKNPLHKKLTILVDLDGPLADFENHFIRFWKEKYPDEMVINYEDRNTFHIKDQYPDHLREKVRSIYESPEFIKNLPMIEGADHFLKDAIALGHEVFICSAPLTVYDPNVVEKYIWVEKNLGKDFIKKIILTKDKTVVRGDYLIDDKPEITGSMTPLWKHVIYHTPYNKHIKTDLRLRADWSNWKDLLL
jgi:5'-nucleotidase